ncbi:flagellar protein FliS [gamma proteobacterium BDW918]|jgi:flagellar protein FliS|uniref:Flagellar secretion chaperone FliS n=1 Tax=Zhongshania aliphaticivorans TaxID=1470434 RepID=A0A127M6R8_9GAMM|nr:flagellar export chaperone FliS [Zhongshania aliphaticivorans]AMO68905.1 flagellar protein FliS [Zhongshania aliphaticivorans]EIF43443.1 flagellar protein FliS [gamma proteobacterium BDW918]|tara:strand:- start:24217 stop:24651 length:435 start_codon:yes stop_codon:yes gene_type:complete
MSYSAGRATQAYASVGAQSSVAAASPHRLIQLLMDGALDRLAVAKGHMQRKDVQRKIVTIDRIMSIVDGLRMSLDHSVNTEMSENLENLYDYMNRRLLLANINNDEGALDEVASLLKELKEAWDAIPSEVSGTESNASYQAELV